MKILVFSDSHKKSKTMDEVLQRQQNHVVAVLHLGDGMDEIRSLEKKYSLLKFHYVCGNCDLGFQRESTKTIYIGGKKIFMTHGHHYSVKMSYDRISYAADEEEADICLFGHTHEPVIFHYSKTLFLNPGSITFPNYSGSPSYGIIDILDTGVICPTVVSKQGGEYRILDVEKY